MGINDELAFELLFLHHGIQLFIDPKSSMEVLQVSFVVSLSINNLQS